MKQWNNLLSWLYPQTLEIAKSKFNGQIKITRFRGKYSAWVGGFEQSGSVYVEKVWQKALSDLAIEQCDNVLVLGLGCGTVIPSLLKKWPDSRIIGVEIDPIMIKLGKKYFTLAKNKNLEIIQVDALDYVKTLMRKFDLVLVDIYVGNKRQMLGKNLKTLGKFVLVNSLNGVSNSVLRL